MTVWLIFNFGRTVVRSVFYCEIFKTLSFLSLSVGFLGGKEGHTSQHPDVLVGLERSRVDRYVHFSDNIDVPPTMVFLNENDSLAYFQFWKNCRQVCLLPWAFQDFKFSLIISWLLRGQGRTYLATPNVLVGLERSRVDRYVHFSDNIDVPPTMVFLNENDSLAYFQFWKNCRQVCLLLWAFQDFKFSLIISWLLRGQGRTYLATPNVLVGLERSRVDRYVHFSDNIDVPPTMVFLNENDSLAYFQFWKNCRQVYLLLWAFQDFKFSLIISWLLRGQGRTYLATP